MPRKRKRVLAENFGVSRFAIQKVATGARWTHIPWPNET